MSMWTQRGDHLEIMDAIPQPIWTIRPDGAVAHLNSAWRAYVQFTGAISLGAGCPAGVHDDDVAIVQGGWRTANGGADAAEVEFRLRRADGAWRWNRARIASVDGASGAWCIGSAVDIHDQRVSVAALHARKHRRQDVVDRADDTGDPATLDGSAVTAAICSALAARAPLDDQLRRCVQIMVEDLDAALAQVWIVDDVDSAFLTLRASAGMHDPLDDGHDRVRLGESTIGRIAADRAPHISNDVRHDPDVDDREWAEGEGMAAFAGFPLELGHRLLGVVALYARKPLAVGTLWALRSVVDAVAIAIDRDRAERVHDVSLEQERGARAWAESVERRYREVFEGVADAIIITDVDRRVQDVNAAASRLIGYSSQSFMERRLDDVIDERPEWIEAMVSELTTGGVWSGEMHLRRADGTSLPAEVRASIVNSPSGAVILSTIRDVSERHHLARLQRDFLAMVTHDLRTPLTSIKGWAQLLRRSQHHDERTVRTLDKLLGQVDQMEHLTHNLAELVRDEAGHLALMRSTVDLGELVQRQVSVVQERFPHQTVLLKLPATPVIGHWDRQRIAQVCQNLLTNAVKYSPESGDIVVSVSSNGSDAWFSVHDLGVGIHASRMSTLFDRIYRRDMTGAGGLGLGLHISAMVVRAHGGDIHAASQPGEGSVFTVTLPLGHDLAP